MKIIGEEEVIIKRPTHYDIRITKNRDRALEMVEWLSENIADFSCSWRQITSVTSRRGTTPHIGYLIIDLYIEFEDEEDMMAFKLRFTD